MRRILPALILALLVPAAASARAGDDSAGAAERLIPRLDEDARERGCVIWNGHATEGNDPIVEIRLRLCPDPDDPARVVGHTVWHSERSGYSLRSVRGTFDARTRLYDLRDVAIEEEAPNPGWRFCTIDRYTLTRGDDDALTGGYESATCSDHASLTLLREQSSGGP